MLRWFDAGQFVLIQRDKESLGIGDEDANFLLSALLLAARAVFPLGPKGTLKRGSLKSAPDMDRRGLLEWTEEDFLSLGLSTGPAADRAAHRLAGGRRLVCDLAHGARRLFLRLLDPLHLLHGGERALLPDALPARRGAAALVLTRLRR